MLSIDVKSGVESQKLYEHVINELNSISEVKKSLRDWTFKLAGMWAVMLSAPD
jgi:predicted O-methyltransferase YrrM